MTLYTYPVVNVLGPTGATGNAGATGTPGFVGSIGYTGSASNVTGATGATGAPGDVGNLGYTGSQGTSGFVGSRGFTGSMGIGFTGSAGVGTLGFTGSRGFTGSSGFGAQGFTGSRGITGPTGPAGSGGGVTGATGPGGGGAFYTGSNAPTGALPGDRWVDSDTAILYTFYNDGFSSAWVDFGAGAIGPTGFAGSGGFTGSRGFTGSAGPTGALGFTGSRGLAGFTGSQGAGFTGSSGTLGFVGSVGFTGSRGFTGSAGFTGSQGFIGSLGYTGSIGFTGSRGDTGFVGSKGLDGSGGLNGIPLSTPLNPGFPLLIDVNSGLYTEGTDQVGISTNGVPRIVITNSESQFYNTIQGTNSVFTVGSNQVDVSATNGGIDITRNGGQAFLDFKNSTAEDYDVRLRQQGTSSALEFVAGGGSVMGSISSSGIFDTKGEVRKLVVQGYFLFSHTLVASDHGKLLIIDGHNLTLNAGVFTTGDNFSVFNRNNVSSRTLSTGAGVTMYMTGTTLTGTRTLGPRSMCTVICIDGAANLFTFTGVGVA